MGPYAWQSALAKSKNLVEPNGCQKPDWSLKENIYRPVNTRTINARNFNDPENHEDLRGLSRTKDAFLKIEMHACLTCALPKPGATAGAVLAHASRMFETLHSKNRPMTFKFGYTHCPYTRWENKRFGYRLSVEKYEAMHILYAAGNPFGPAFLEASLIDKFNGTMAQSRC